VSEPLPFTGERFTPECVREIWYEHWHRYAWAARVVQGKRVLDAACGEGYGAALLARNAASVLGADISESAIAHARARYGDLPNLRFAQHDVTALDALPSASFDVIVSFETLEHVHDQERMIAGFERLLAPGGVLLISSPDKRTYSEVGGFRNEFHVRELYREELLTLLRAHFDQVRLYGQKLLFQSAIWSLDQTPERFIADTVDDNGTPRAQLAYAPWYYLAACARAAADLPQALACSASWFGDAQESVYAHYNHEIRKNMQAGTLLADMQRRLDAAQAQAETATMSAAKRERWWARWWRRGTR
jgi:SAM-dependent methyltransferase